MAFNASLEMVKGVAKIALTGELDASSAPVFKAEVEKAAELKAKRLVLLMQDLNYMASAGLRVLIFAKQKMGRDVDLYLIAPQSSVAETIQMTGFNHSVMILDKYDADEIENL